jgi:Domain of unknown function (DUF4148)
MSKCSHHCISQNTFKELVMKKFSMFGLSLVVLASSNVFAEGKTRAEVYQELVEAQQNGSAYITDSSYPDIDPVYSYKVAQMRAEQERLAQQKAGNAVAAGAQGANAAN